MNRRHTQRHWGTLKQDDEGTWEMSCKTQADCARRGGQHTEERILRVQTDEGASEAALSSLPCPACISSTDSSWCRTENHAWWRRQQGWKKTGRQSPRARRPLEAGRAGQAVAANVKAGWLLSAAWSWRLVRGAQKRSDIRDVPKFNYRV